MKAKEKSKIFSIINENLVIAIGIAIELFPLLNIFVLFYTGSADYLENYSYIFSSFLGIIVYSLILALTKKSSRATIISFALILILSFISILKIKCTQQPLYFSDIKFLGQTSNLLELVSKDIVWQAVKMHILYAICLIPVIILNLKFDYEIKQSKARIIIVIIDVVLLLLLFIPNRYTKDFYLKIFFNSENYKDYESYTNDDQYYMVNGIINGMYGKYLNNIFWEPENYDENSIDEQINNVEDMSTEILGTPNIIVYFCESFWDINQLQEIKFDKEIASNFNSLKNEGKFINLISPTYGGMSENVAFEFFTGTSMNYFPNGYIPVMSLYSRNNNAEMPSIVKVLKNNGYSSKIIFGKDYYNSENAMLKIGFDEYENIYKTLEKDELITDEYIVDTLIDDLEEKNGKVFYVIESFEAHMPFSKDKYEQYDINIVESNLNENENITIRSYAQAIYNSDKQLKRLYEYINTMDEPTILIFFGDHLPYLYSENNLNVIDKLQYFDTDDELLNLYRLYNIQGLILANYDIENLDTPEYSGMDLILPNLINQMDIENTNYYKWLDSTKDIISASNKHITLDKNGNMYNTDEVTGEMRELLDFKDKVTYKYYIK